MNVDVNRLAAPFSITMIPLCRLFEGLLSSIFKIGVVMEYGILDTTTNGFFGR